jgi:hypothetical protein
MPGVKMGDELDEALRSGVFQGKTLSGQFILLTRSKNGIAQRIGLLSVHGWWAKSDRLEDSAGVHIRGCFPGTWQDILLE